MSDLDKRLNQIEQKIDAEENISSPHYNANVQKKMNEEIDLREIWDVLWGGKWWVIGITFLFAVIGVLYALYLPNLYKSEGLYAPAQKDSSGGGLAAQYSGLAALAGISVGASENDNIDQAIILIKNWPFIELLIEKHQLKPLIFGVKGWDPLSGDLIWDLDVYNPSEKVWTRQVKEDEDPEPSSYQTFKKYRKMIEVERDEKNGVISIKVEHLSPLIAKEWVDLISTELNLYFQKRDMQEARDNIEYASAKISDTRIDTMKTIFYGIIEAETKKMMLSEVSSEYLMKEIVPPKISEERESPNRALIVVFITFLGGVFSIFFIFVRYLF